MFLSACIERLQVLMPTLKKYFHDELMTSKNKMRLSTKEAEFQKSINKNFNLLTHIDTELYFIFLRHVLPPICNLNLEFHSKTPRFHKLYSWMDEVCKALLKNFMKPEDIESGDIQVYKNPANFLQHNEIYVDPWVAAFLEVNPRLTASTIAVSYTNVSKKRPYRIIESNN